MAAWLAEANCDSVCIRSLQRMPGLPLFSAMVRSTRDWYAAGLRTLPSCAPPFAETGGPQPGPRLYAGHRNYQRNYQDVASVLLSSQSERDTVAVASRPPPMGDLHVVIKPTQVAPGGLHAAEDSSCRRSCLALIGRRSTAAYQEWHLVLQGDPLRQMIASKVP